MKSPNALAARLMAALAMTSLCAAGCASNQPTSGGGEVLSVGAPLALTGPIAEQAKQMQEGFQLYLDQHGGKLGGIKVDLHVEDSAADPTVTVTKTRKLIKSDNVTLIVGGALAPESLAIRDLVIASNMAYVSPISSADDLTQRKRSPLIARTGPTSSQPNMPFGAYAATTLGYKRIAIVAQDYAYGWESAGGFQYGFEKSGGKVTTKIYAPLGAADWAPFVRQIPRDVDAVYALPVGGGVAPFIRAYIDAGLKNKLPLLGGPDLADEDAIQAAGKDAVGILHSHMYNPNNSFTQPFANAFKQKYGVIPSYWGESTYGSFEWIDKAITSYKNRTKASDKDTVAWIRDKPTEFIQEIKKVGDQAAPPGPRAMDDYNQVILDIYVIKVVDQGGTPTRQTVATIPHVSQFWTVSPDAFLAQPVFSRDFPH